MRRLSRQVLARTTAAALVAGEPEAVVFERLAAHLIDTRRTKESDLIMRDVGFYLAEAGYVTALVTSASPLTSSERTKVEADITKTTGAKHIRLDEQVEPELVGGMKVTLPGRELNQSSDRLLKQFTTLFNRAEGAV